MFAQVIQGKTKNPEAFGDLQDRWDKELRPGAKGWLGTTGGVAADGTVLLVVRFESEAAAKANSDRPEQGAFFQEVSKHFDGEPSFVNSSDIDLLFDGGSDDAGFVQVMIYDVKDRKRLKELDDSFIPELKKIRPDLIGAVRIWDGDTAIDVNYFTSEAEARAGEKQMMESMGDQFQEFAALSTEPTFIDLPNPLLHSA